LADRIRAFFPALVVVEELKPAPAELGGADAAPRAAPMRLGDFLIPREGGRGGVGGGYEAGQVSLGRPGAFKGLPPGAPAEPPQAERFRREARAAARLHHTNIVPVFGVGEEGGTHYYVMQYIEGRPLDEVLAELRRLRDEAAGRLAPSEVMERGPSRAPAGPGDSTGLHELPSTVLRGGLRGGRFYT